MKCKVFYSVYKCKLESILPNLLPALRKQCPVAGPFESFMESTVCLSDIEKDLSELATFSVQFASVFEEAKTKIEGFCANSQVSNFVLAEYPVFSINGSSMIGISVGKPDNFACVFDVTWVDVDLYDYNRWFADCDFDLNDDFDEIYSLYRTVKDLDAGYGINMTYVHQSNEVELRSGRNDSVLKLREVDRECFVKYLDGLFELGIEGEETYRKAIELDDRDDIEDV